MTAAMAMLRLVAARARRRPGRWLLTVLGLGLATAFAGGVAVESTVAGDEAARSVLGRTSGLDRKVAVSSPSVVTSTIAGQAERALHAMGAPASTEVMLLAPVRLSGVVVRLAAIDPLDRWLAGGATPGLPRCRAARCPMLLVGGHLRRPALTASGVRVTVSRRATLRSAVPLGFPPAAGQVPVLVTGDLRGLQSVAGLSGIFRTFNWVATLPLDQLRAWQLADSERRLQAAQAGLLADAPGLSSTAPFAPLDAARAGAAAAPKRLLLAGGGALAALVLFLVLAVGSVRRDVEAELARLDLAGARPVDRVLFVALESATVCGAGLLLGGVGGLLLGVLEASGAGAPVDGVLTHSLLTVTAMLALVAGWVCASLLITGLLLIRGTRVGDLLAATAATALAAALVLGSRSSSAVALLLAPLACLAAGLLVFRGAAGLLRGGERLARRGRVMTRLALVNLARSPSGPSLAIAFIALSTGLGGLALAYRATLLRSTADQAANQVPLDATVASGSSFATPLQLAPLRRWQSLAGGSVWPVRRTEASYLSGGSSVTVPALGVPSAALAQLHGWRQGDGSAPLSVLAHRIATSASAAPGPVIPRGSVTLLLRAGGSGIDVTLTADLRGPDDNVIRVPLGHTSRLAHTLRAALPAGTRSGAWHLAGLEATEPAGLEITTGHQNAENPAPPPELTTTLRLGQLRISGAQRESELDISHWLGVGAAGHARSAGFGVAVDFRANGQLGLIREPEAGDRADVPVLVDPQTAGVAGRGRRLGLTVDGLPIRARVAGVIRRFPTLPADSAGLLVADEQTLGAALDAQTPGQGRADELWVSTAHPRTLRAALGGSRLRQLSGSFRSDAQRSLREAPIARAVLRTLIAAGAVTGLLAVLGLLVSLLGSGRDKHLEDDLVAQGVGPAALRKEARLRLLLASALGVVIGLVIAVALTRLAVATVRAAGTAAFPRPPVVTVAPWAELGLWSLAALVTLAAVAWLATASQIRKATP